jgi:tripartite-type tricarboxylate transporter receptor subunit TctC
MIARGLIRGAVAAALVGSIGLWAGIAAAADDNFYAGKTITLYAGFPPGGGVDGEMRVVARYYANFIPGHPNIVAKNMPGAGGIILANQLYNNTDPDGMTIGMPGRSGFLLSKIVKEKGVNFDLAKFSYIGSAGSTNSTLWLRSETGIKTVEDLKKSKKPIVIGAWSSRSQNAVVPKILNQYEGWPFKVVHGYPGTNEVVIALERGEIDGLYSHEGSIQNTRPDLISSGRIRAIVQTFEELPNVPILETLISNPKEKALLSLMSTPSRIGLPVLAPPGVPADRLEILRKSYNQMVQNKDYRDEAEKRGLPVGSALTGVELQKLVAANLSTVPDDVLKEYLELTADHRGK